MIQLAVYRKDDAKPLKLSYIVLFKEYRCLGLLTLLLRKWSSISNDLPFFSSDLRNELF